MKIFKELNKLGYKHYTEHTVEELDDLSLESKERIMEQALVLRWFRNKYNLHHEILLDQTTQPKYCFEIHKYEDFGNYEKMENKDWFLYRTYEEAEHDCLIKLIEIVKNK